MIDLALGVSVRAVELHLGNIYSSLTREEHLCFAAFQGGDDDASRGTAIEF